MSASGRSAGRDKRTDRAGSPAPYSAKRWPAAARPFPPPCRTAESPSAGRAQSTRRPQAGRRRAPWRRAPQAPLCRIAPEEALWAPERPVCAPGGGRHAGVAAAAARAVLPATPAAAVRAAVHPACRRTRREGSCPNSTERDTGAPVAKKPLSPVTIRLWAAPLSAPETPSRPAPRQTLDPADVAVAIDGDEFPVVE